MTDVLARDLARARNPAVAARRAHRRRAAEARFRAASVAGTAVALLTLVVLLVALVGQGLDGLRATRVALDVAFDAATVDPDGTGDPAVIAKADFNALVKEALRARFPDVTTRQDRKRLNGLVSSGALYELRDMLLDDPGVIGTTQRVWLPASDDVDQFAKGHIDRAASEAERRVSDQEIAWLDALEADEALQTRFSRIFFTAGDSREPELAGIRGALVGSLLTMAVTAIIAFPLGVATAIYLEEFAPRNRWTDLIEVNINNLAAVPSIVFGLLGLAIFLNVVGLPRSAPLVGGLVLALMSLPVIIIAGRAALTAVPPSIREAARGVGASPLQVVAHHVLPLAMPGILTGTIIAMARALGETAPLLMIGMVAFVVDVPTGPMDAATVLPVQIYLWADSPERAFVGKTAAAIVVLLGFLITMNGVAVYLRRRFEVKW
ncbi:MAG: phosphate ABC transporter permease PstA [Alphaproteobacteria bacterium]|nr:phosphate ABC transporter permease PstA [Alphaproteobacteria bacterium]